MNFFEWLRGGKRKPETRAVTEYGFIDGVAVDGSGMATSWNSYRNGMSIPGAYRAAILLSDLIGSVPWHAYRQIGDGPAVRISPTPMLLEQPSPPDTRMTTFSSLALDLIWHGNAVALIASRNQNGFPTSVLPVSAANVQVRRNREGVIEYLVAGITDPLPYTEVVHIKGPCEAGSLRGMGVLELHYNTLDLATEQNRQARSISRHGVPTGVLESSNPDLTGEEAAKLKTGWLAAQRDRTIAVLNASTKFTPLSWNPEELQLVDARKFTLHEIALIFGIPLSFLGVEGGSMTYSNIEQDGLNLLKYSLNGHLSRFEQTLTLHLPRGTEAKANLDSILRADTLARYQAHATGIEKGFLKPSEARALENREPIDGLDEAWLKKFASPPEPVPVQLDQSDPNPDEAVDDGNGD